MKSTRVKMAVSGVLGVVAGVLVEPWGSILAYLNTLLSAVPY